MAHTPTTDYEPPRAAAPAPTSDNGQAAAKAQPREGTRYVILERVEAADGNGPAWRPCGTAQTPAGKDAALKTVSDRDGAFKAVPDTNWKGGKVFKQETKPVTVSKDIED